jgi:hypothetical protein
MIVKLCFKYILQKGILKFALFIFSYVTNMIMLPQFLNFISQIQNIF